MSNVNVHNITSNFNVQLLKLNKNLLLTHMETFESKTN
jgi:hypothetical protein